MKAPRFFRFLIGVALIAQLPIVAFAQSKTESEPVAKKDEKESAKIATVDVLLKPMSVYQSFDAVFESTRSKEVVAEFDTWSDLKISSVVDEGSVVSAGQEILKFDTKSIEKAIKEADFGVASSTFELESALLNQKEMQTTFDLDKALAVRTWENAKQDYEYYKSVQLPERMADLDYSEKSAGYFLEYSQDELDQLQQMYTEDELTEESEEIVLKRARRSVESAARSKKKALQRVARDRETNVPRENVSREDQVKRSELAFKRKMVTLPIAKQKADNALAQVKFALKNKLEKLNELRTDLDKMKLTAPSDGVVYYGKCVRGKWVGGTGSAKRRLEPDKKVVANNVVMTIVDVGQLMVRASLDQTTMGMLSPSLRGKAKISATNVVVPATVKSVSRIPLDSGKYDCQILVENLPNDGSVMPGMSCKLSFLVYENKQAIVAPKSSVFSDDGGVSHFVFVVDGEKTSRKPVMVGHTSGDSIEIRDGLSAGDKIAKTRQ